MSLCRALFIPGLWLTVLLPEFVSAQSPRLLQLPQAPLRGLPVQDLVVGDLHNDGRMQVVGMVVPATGDDESRIVIEEFLHEPGQPGSGRFVPYASLPAESPVAVLLTDLEGDGDLDLVVAQDRGDDAMAVWINDGEPADGSHRAVFRRGTQRLTYDLAADLLAVPRAQDAAVDLLLVRAIGRSAVLLRQTVGAASVDFEARQLLSAADAAFTGGLVTDLDGDGRSDILLYGNGCWVWLQRDDAHGDIRFDPSPSALGACDFAAPGVLIAAAVNPLPPGAGGSGGRSLLAFAGSDGRDHQVLLEWSMQSALHRPLLHQADGQTRAFGFLDVDQDGQDDLLAVRSGPDGSLVHRRDGDGYIGTLGAFGRGWGVATAPLLAGQQSVVWVAGWLQASSLWQPGSDSAVLPSLSFGGAALQNRPMGYFEAGRIGETLQLTPFAQTSTVVQILATGPDGGAASGNRSLLPGMSEVSGDQSAPVSPGEWQLQIVGSTPPGSNVPVQPQQASAVMMPSRDPLECPFCIAVCVVVGDCRCAVIKGHGAGLLSGTFMGSLQEVHQLRRLRDERLALSAGGQHYIDLYRTLQQDLYEAIFSDPLLYHDLWQLKDAWMPALDNLLDGDGQRLVDATMQSSLQEVLGRLAALGSSRLRETLEHERVALRLDSLQGLPISTLQHQWELSRVFADGFD